MELGIQGSLSSPIRTLKQRKALEHSSNLRREKKKKRFITQVITSPGLSSFLKPKGKELPKLDTRQKRSREGAVLKARKSLLRSLPTKANLTLTMMSLYFLNLNFCYLMKSEV